ncbi:unnamed protein product [Sphenostylis stenocarpa]|uniref:Morc S5 domain-containing protein n=1 Tax=Sphenostylis stenocarpa TaxID=92480 RepID=A0AA86VVW2_9FABA|nr:unnamed protein product [Sphenostylis stenocarpa]
MGPTEIVDLSSDEESEKVCLKAVKLEGDFVINVKQYNGTDKGQLAKYKRSRSNTTGQDSEENISSNAPSTGHSNSSVLDQGPLSVDDTGISYVSPIGAAPLCRQFWKAGNYDDGIGSKVTVQRLLSFIDFLSLSYAFRVADAKNYLHVHPMFLHSNATSHKWAFGAIAELLDNAVDEIQNGATFVTVDKISNPRDGIAALLIQDDGGGMDPEAMRRCMSFGFSDKKSQFAIGRCRFFNKPSIYEVRGAGGNELLVFLTVSILIRILTQSIGLLSYTYLTQTQLDRIVVPMVNYEFNTSTGSLKVLNGNEHFVSNLSLLLRWSPYSSEADLLKQFDDIGSHGTKVIIYNLWCNDDGNLELDFDTDSTVDIRIAGDVKQIDTIKAWKSINEEHIANRFRYSLQVYLSILYLKIPESFQIILRGQVVKPHNIADDLKYPQFVKYAPLIGGSSKGTALTVTTIGFLKEAPQVNIHGFNVYHKNRLILPFWQVVSYLDSRGRGVVGILQADFIEPTHNKQDFERTSLFQKLEGRLKEMTWEYWDTHCTLFGYRAKRKLPTGFASIEKPLAVEKPIILNKSSSSLVNAKSSENTLQCSHNKRKAHEFVDLLDKQKLARKDNVANDCFSQNKQVVGRIATHDVQEDNLRGIKMRARVVKLKSKIQEAQDEYKRLLAEIKSLDPNPFEVCGSLGFEDMKDHRVLTEPPDCSGDGGPTLVAFQI